MTFKRWIQRAVFALFAAFAIAHVAAQGGLRDLTPLSPPQPVENDGKLEVLEFFAYAAFTVRTWNPGWSSGLRGSRPM